MGIAYEALKAVNPSHYSRVHFGVRAELSVRARAGFDQIAQGMGGLMWVTGIPGRDRSRRHCRGRQFSRYLRRDRNLLALAERERSGVGQWVQTSLLEAQIALMDFQAARYLVDGVVPGQAGNDHPYSTPMGVFETSDGFINIGVGGDGQCARALRGAGATRSRHGA